MTPPGELLELGRRIRKLRVERRMTLKQVERAAGLSATHLSEIERGRTSPTIGALARVARALGKSPAFLIEDRELADIAVVHKESTRAFPVAAGVTAEVLSPGIPGSVIHAYRLVFRETPVAEWAPDGAHGDVIYYVAAGACEVHLENQTVPLAAGDALQASLSMEHRVRSVSGAAEIVALWTRSLEESNGGPKIARRPKSRSGVTPLGDPAPLDALPLDPAPAELGRRIKMLRVERGLTLKELESLGGISATHVSEIERGKASPTIGALRRIAVALGIKPACLIEPQHLPQVAWLEAGDREAQRIQWNAAALSPLTAPTHGASIGAAIVTLPIGGDLALTHHHQGEEWVTVLSGQAEIAIDGETHVLRQGDALHFRAERPHSYANPASAPAVLLVASRPRLAI